MKDTWRSRNQDKMAVWATAIVVVGYILNGIYNPIPEEKPKKDESRYEGIVSKIPQKVADSPIASKLRNLNKANAYSIGLEDGLHDVKEIAIAAKWTSDNSRANLEQLTKLQNSFFDIMELTIKDTDPAVFQDYKRGWNVGANSVELK